MSIKINSTESADYVRPVFHQHFPEMYYVGRVFMVLDLGTGQDPNFPSDKDKARFRIEVEFPDCRAVMREGEDAEPQVLGKTYTASWGWIDKETKAITKPSHLYTDYSTVLGAYPTEKMMEDFDPIEFFLGKWFRFKLKPSTNGKYTNIVAVEKMPEGAQIQHKPEKGLVKFDWDENYNPEIIGKLVRGLPERFITSSNNWKSRHGEAPVAGAEIGGPNPEFSKPQPIQPAVQPKSKPSVDDVPF